MATRGGPGLRPPRAPPGGGRAHPGRAAAAGRRRSRRMKRLAFILPVVTVLAFVIIIGPIAIVVLAAFSPTEFFTFPPPGLSLRWFVEFFRLDNMRGAFALSCELALVSSCLATILATMAALALVRRRGVVTGLLQALFLAPLMFSTII